MMWLREVSCVKKPGNSELVSELPPPSSALREPRPGAAIIVDRGWDPTQLPDRARPP
jgi:hypothetical protein